MVPVPGYSTTCVCIFRGVFGSSKHPVNGDDGIIAISVSATRDVGKERRREGRYRQPRQSSKITDRMRANIGRASGD